MSSQLAMQFTLLVFTLSAHATPTQRMNTGSFVVETRPKSLRARDNSNLTAASNATDALVFNSAFATKEQKAVKIKYARAGKLLAGVGLNPDTHPETGYPPFNPPNSTAIPQTSAKLGTLGASNIPASTEDTDGSESGIIGMSPVSAEPQVVHMPLTDDVSGPLDVLYYGPMSFGSQAEVLQVDVDTGSADLWIPVNCKNCHNKAYQAQKSTSYKASSDPCAVSYGIGEVRGYVGVDAVAIGAARVPQQTFCAANKLSDDLNEEPNNGLMGLAFGTIAQANNHTATFFENLLQQKTLAASVFSVHMTRGVEKGSEVCFGCYDPTKSMGPVIWNNIVSRTYWTVAMNGTAINGTRYMVDDLVAAIDTGTSLIYLPDEVAADFYAQIPGSAPAVQYGAGFYTFPCDTALTVSIILNGRAYAIHPTDFNIGRPDSDDDACIGGIIALGKDFAPNLAIVGAEFLKSWYAVFDYAGAGRVGFAPSVNNR